MRERRATSRPLVVVEIAGEISAAFAARLLADLGAEVTKVIAALQAPSPLCAPLDIPKRLVQLDGTEADEARLDALLRTADVLLCGAPLAALEAAPLKLASRHSRYPWLITAAVTPFGESGPHRDYQGTDLIALHAGGFGFGIPPRVVDPEREHPLGIPGEQVSLLCGLVLTGGVLHALLERDRDGAGRHVELSAQDAVVSWMFNNIDSYLSGDRSSGRLARDHPSARRLLLACADGHLTAMIGQPDRVRAWLEILDAPAASLRARLDGGEKPASLQAEIDAETAAWVARRTRREVTDIAQARHVPIEPVLNAAELLASPQLAARGFWRRSEPHSIRIPGHPFGPSSEADPPRRLPSHAPAVARTTGANTTERGPLAGLRIVDFSRIFAAPIATRMLAALGADVIRVESTRTLDPMRRRAFSFRVVNGDKRSVELDAREAADAPAVHTLIRAADAVVENFTTGTMERLGLGWERLHAENPGLIMLSVSGMGRTGPYAHHAMFGQLAHAYAGLTAIIGYEGGPPRGTEDGGYWSDPVTGYAAAVALLAALRERAGNGIGRWIDISLVEATAALAIEPVIAAQQGDLWGPRGNVHPTMAPHDVYRCAPAGEDRWLALAVRHERDWQMLCRVTGQAELVADPALATPRGRRMRHEVLRTAIERWTRVRTPEEAARLLQAAGIPAAPSATAAGLLADPHLHERAIFLKDASAPGGVVMRAIPPWRLHPDAAIRFGPGPRFGEHNAEVLAASNTPAER